MITDKDRRALKRRGYSWGAYDGARKRRFTLFEPHPSDATLIIRHEFDTKGERDSAMARALTALVRP